MTAGILWLSIFPLGPRGLTGFIFYWYITASRLGVGRGEVYTFVFLTVQFHLTSGTFCSWRRATSIPCHPFCVPGSMLDLSGTETIDKQVALIWQPSHAQKPHGQLDQFCLDGSRQPDTFLQGAQSSKHWQARKTSFQTAGEMEATHCTIVGFLWNEDYYEDHRCNSLKYRWGVREEGGEAILCL